MEEIKTGERPLLSIIIPAYNVENYLDECLESVTAQSYGNMEIIIVDDGSVDGTGGICDRWANQDKRIRVIHQKNGGMSAARNTGIKAASGGLFAFVDSDDVTDPRMYDKLYETMKETQCPLVCCREKRAEQFESIYLTEEKAAGVTLYTAEDAYRDMLLDRRCFSVVWNKLYRKELIDGVPFPDKKYHEDEFWIYQVLARAERIAVLDAVYYGYRQRPNSIMSQKYSLKRLDLLEARAQRLDFWIKAFPGLVSAGRCDYRFECIRALQLCYLHLEGESRKLGEEKILSMKKRHTLRYRDYSGLPLGRRVWCVLSTLSLKWTARIRNRYHFGP